MTTIGNINIATGTIIKLTPYEQDYARFHAKIANKTARLKRRRLYHEKSTKKYYIHKLGEISFWKWLKENDISPMHTPFRPWYEILEPLDDFIVQGYHVDIKVSVIDHASIIDGGIGCRIRFEQPNKANHMPDITVYTILLPKSHSGPGEKISVALIGCSLRRNFQSDEKYADDTELNDRKSSADHLRSMTELACKLKGCHIPISVISSSPGDTKI